MFLAYLLLKCCCISVSWICSYLLFIDYELVNIGHWDFWGMMIICWGRNLSVFGEGFMIEWGLTYLRPDTCLVFLGCRILLSMICLMMILGCPHILVGYCRLTYLVCILSRIGVDLIQNGFVRSYEIYANFKSKLF